MTRRQKRKTRGKKKANGEKKWSILFGFCLCSSLILAAQNLGRITDFKRSLFLCTTSYTKRIAEVIEKLKKNKNNLARQNVATEVLSHIEKSMSPTDSAISSALWCFVQKLAKHHVWILPLPLSSPLVFSQSYCLTIPWYRHWGSCTTNIRNSVNFTLCCLPKNPGPRFGDLASRVSFQSFPPACHQQRTLFLLHPCLDAAPRKHLEVTVYRVTSNKSEHAQIRGTVQSALCSEKS